MPENKSLDRWIVEGEVKKSIPEMGKLIGSWLSAIGKKRPGCAVVGGSRVVMR
jgi:hypothetical protein